MEPISKKVLDYWGYFVQGFPTTDVSISGSSQPSGYRPRKNARKPVPKPPFERDLGPLLREIDCGSEEQHFLNKMIW